MKEQVGFQSELEGMINDSSFSQQNDLENRLEEQRIKFEQYSMDQASKIAELKSQIQRMESQNDQS